MSTSWTPSKPKSVNWSIAAKLDHDVLISDGSAMVRLDPIRSPLDTKHVERVIGADAVEQMLVNGAWEKGKPNRDPQDALRLLRDAWEGYTADIHQDAVHAPVTLSDWARWMWLLDYHGQRVQEWVRAATISTGHIIPINHHYLDLFTSPKVTLADLKFLQREGRPSTAILVTHQGRQLGVFMPVTNRNRDFLAGLGALMAKGEAHIP